MATLQAHPAAYYSVVLYYTVSVVLYRTMPLYTKAT